MQKRLLIGIIVCLLLLGSVFGFGQWQDARREARLVKTVDRKLSDADRKIYHDRLAETEKKLAQAASDQDKFELLRYKAIQLQGLGQLAEARSVFLQAAGVLPKDPDIYVNLHLVYLEMEGYDLSREMIKKAISLKPNDADLWRRYILLEKAKFDSSPEHIKSLFAEALSKTKSNIDIIIFYAGYLEEIGDLQGAKEYWQKAIETNSKSKNIYQAEIDRLQKAINEKM